MKAILKKMTFVVLIISVIFQQIVPFSFAENNQNTNIIIRKTVRESIESYNKLTEGKDSIFVSNSNQRSTPRNFLARMPTKKDITATEMLMAAISRNRDVKG